MWGLGQCPSWAGQEVSRQHMSPQRVRLASWVLRLRVRGTGPGKLVGMWPGELGGLPGHGGRSSACSGGPANEGNPPGCDAVARPKGRTELAEIRQVRPRRRCPDSPSHSKDGGAPQSLCAALSDLLRFGPSGLSRPRLPEAM